MPATDARGAFAVLCAALLLPLAPASAAQDVGAAPAYGTLRLPPAINPDPYRIEVQAGGRVDATALGGDCRGHVANAPDLRLEYRPVPSLPLLISARAETAIMLAVNSPDGAWHCASGEDGQGSNPGLRFDAPVAGRYAIWVGTAAPGALHPAVLQISEIYDR